MEKKKTIHFGWVGILFLFGIHLAVILGTLYFVWTFGHRYLVEPYAGTWNGWSEMPQQVKIFWGAMIFLGFSASFFTYKVFRSVRKLFR